MLDACDPYVFIDNVSNTSPSAVAELSDLHACDMPVQMKVKGGPAKTLKITFASFEHAWNVLRFVRFPTPGSVRHITTVHNVAQRFEVSFASAALFMQQFERDGVFSSWAKFDAYYDIHKMPCDRKSHVNIGLIARYVIGNSERSEQIRQIVRAVAADQFCKNRNDLVSECIAACLWKSVPNLSCYVKTLRKLCKIKFQSNHHIRNIMYATGHSMIQHNLDKCRMVTETRRAKAGIYTALLLHERTLLTWTLWPDATVAILMAFHARLGQKSPLSRLNCDIFFIVLNNIICDKQKNAIRKHLLHPPRPSRVTKKTKTPLRAN